ncbi:Na(+)/H(+) antiporter NhaH [Streptomyces sp. YIM 130001]|uniref:cation:proton antiporter n=1 Tax=Streptomyces sp. YIM 130001 TaxID=2259644 RepID=UPI000EEC11B1|nr:cation:proton antiporter [Streptomyces sp. YIM 130001]RII20457.1 Na(+)/H(+) antiporter NhaH [Streptomyces sp. YIM 130001]
MELTAADVGYACLGVGALLAAVLPRLVARQPMSMPMVFLAVGFLVYVLPTGLPELDPVGDRVWVEHLTEVCVIVALMGAGLAINRPFGRRTWSTTWRLLGITMPLSVLAAGLVAWGLLDWPPAVALLLGAVLAPTDPVLAAEVRVGEPTDAENDEDEVRFALTSEAGLNDGLAFPLVLAALAMFAASQTGWSAAWVGHWLWSDVALRVTAGVVVGLLVGRLLGWMFFRAGWEALRLSEHREGFVALAATFVSYGLAEVLQGYGFLAVFTTACAIRSAEHAHGYQVVMHTFMEQVERLLTAGVLFLVGGFIASGGLSGLSWGSALTAVLVLLVIRPATGWIAQLRGKTARKERAVTAVFGIRGIGSFFYLAYALGHDRQLGSFGEELWAVVTFVVLLSVVLHGAAAAPVLRRLDRSGH